MVIEALVMLDGPLDRTRLHQLLQERVVDVFPVFSLRTQRSRVPGRLPRWVRTPGFDVADHVRDGVVDAPGDDAAVQAYVERFLDAPLPEHRPLWEVHVLSGLREGTALFVRLHHALADGIALTRVLLSITDADAKATPARREPLPMGESLIDGIRPGVAITRARPSTRGRSGVRFALHSPRVILKLLATRNPRTATSGAAGPAKRVVWSTPISLARVKELAAATDTTVNDVLVAALAGALHRYQTHHDGVAIDVHTMIPVNLRPLDLPLPTRLGNRFAVVLMALPSGRLGALPRLAETKRRMDIIKGSPEPLLTFGLIYTLGWVGTWMSRLGVRFFSAKADAVTTNVPGPPEHRYLAGTRIRGLLGWVPGSSHQTLGTCIFTYAGVVQIGFKADAGAIPDPERILADFEAELAELQLVLSPADEALRATA